MKYTQKNDLDLLNKTNKVYDKPLVTIITAVYNGEQTIERTIESVINQTYRNIEYIIIDGGSEDNTLNVINKYKNNISYWISEKDRGIYDAINKGIKICNGEIIGILNSDDYYVNNAVEKIVKEFNKTKKSIVYGNMIKIYEDDDFRCYKEIKPGNLDEIYKKMTLLHPATFIKKEVYKKLGLYNDFYKYAADWEFLKRAKMNSVGFKKIDEILTYFRIGGATTNINSINMKSKKEMILISARKINALINYLDSLFKYIIFYFFRKIYINYRKKKYYKYYQCEKK